MNFQQIRLDIFKNQDEEVGDFNVTFLIDGKKLLANKFILQSVSTTFTAMFSDVWNNGEPIPITTYSYNDFYQFLSFLYSEECLLTDDNIFTMVDIAEFYQVGLLNNYCEEFLKDVEWTSQNIFHILETSVKYSMIKLTKSLIRSVRLNYCNSEEFLGVSKELLHAILEADQSEIPNDEELFERVYKWAEKQAVAKKALNSNLSLDETTKEIFAEFMPFFDLDNRFVTDFVVKKSLIPSGQKRNAALSNLNDAAPTVIVKIIDEDGRIMKGRFFDTENAYADIQAVGRRCCSWFGDDEEDIDYLWSTAREEPLPRQQILRENYDGKWCLSYDCGADLRLKIGVDYNHYFLAEMFPEKQFVMSDRCSIDAIRY